jgi:hypothetical protein
MTKSTIPYWERTLAASATYRVGGDHGPVKLPPVRQLIMPWSPSTETATQSAVSSICGATLFLLSIPRRTSVAFLSVSSSLEYFVAQLPEAGIIDRIVNVMLREQASRRIFLGISNIGFSAWTLIRMPSRPKRFLSTDLDENGSGEMQRITSSCALVLLPESRRRSYALQSTNSTCEFRRDVRNVYSGARGFPPRVQGASDGAV